MQIQNRFAFSKLLSFTDSDPTEFDALNFGDEMETKALWSRYKFKPDCQWKFLIHGIFNTYLSIDFQI